MNPWGWIALCAVAAWVANKIRLVIEEVDKQSDHYRNARRDGRL